MNLNIMPEKISNTTQILIFFYFFFFTEKKTMPKFVLTEKNIFVPLFFQILLKGSRIISMLSLFTTGDRWQLIKTV